MKPIHYSIQVRGTLIDLSTPQVMGILNCTPDSFYAGSRKQTEEEIAHRANEIVEQGGTMIDVGAFSTRPGASVVSETEEMERLKRALAIVRREQPTAIVSVDTYRPLVARRCIEEWQADIINDVSEGGITGIANVPIHETENMFDVVGQLQVPYILMSVKSNLNDMILSFAKEVQQLRDRGVKDIILDPGFGFGKDLQQNYAVLNGLEELRALELPLLIGVSRKRMIYQSVGGDASTALNGTTAIHAASLMKGANILRVHDVAEAVETVKIISAMQQSSPNDEWA